METLKLSDRQIEMLKKYASVYKDERNRDITKDPIVAVQSQRERTSAEGYSDKSKFVVDNDNGEYPDFDTISEVIDYLAELEYDCNFDDVKEELENRGECDRENFRIYTWYYDIVWEDVAFFLTIAEAERYKKYQKHNLCKPRVFTHSCGYGNRGDLVEVLPLLLQIGKLLLEQQEVTLCSSSK